MSPRELREVLDAGQPLDAQALNGWMYRGVSLGLWGWVESLSWKTFAKCFHEGRGWNVRLHQDGLDAPPRPRKPTGFGPFRVVQDGERVMLDYGWIKDPLVSIDGDTRLLGRSDFAGMATPSYFLLERAGPLPFIWPG